MQPPADVQESVLLVQAHLRVPRAPPVDRRQLAEDAFETKVRTVEFEFAAAVQVEKTSVDVANESAALAQFDADKRLTAEPRVGGNADHGIDRILDGRTTEQAQVIRHEFVDLEIIRENEVCTRASDVIRMLLNVGPSNFCRPTGVRIYADDRRRLGGGEQKATEGGEVLEEAGSVAACRDSSDGSEVEGETAPGKRRDSVDFDVVRKDETEDFAVDDRHSAIVIHRRKSLNFNLLRLLVPSVWI